MALLHAAAGPGARHELVRITGDGGRLSRVKLRDDGGISSTEPAPSASPEPNPFPNPLPQATRYLAPPGHPILSEPEGARFDEAGWNHVEFRVNGSAVQLFLNSRRVPIDLQAAGSAPGPVRLLVETAPDARTEVRDVALDDFSLWRAPKSQAGAPALAERLLATSFAGYGEAVADIDGDGRLDVVAAKSVFFGPDFKSRTDIADTRPLDPGGYAPGLPLAELVDDFTGDGRPDILMSTWPSGGPVRLYVNPGERTVRWTSYEVIQAMDGETFTLTDLDGDGHRELVFAAGGTINAARPVEGDPSLPWTVTQLTETGPWGQRNAHGLGVGDVDGDGLPDLLSAWGWWEQPRRGSGGTWRFHPEAFGRRAFPGNPGGAQMFAYDVDGDGLSDVVTSLEGHGRGLAWFRQVRAADGAIHFVRHMIMDIDPQDSRGVAFSEIHSLALADIDGDGLLDLVAGKSNTSVGHWNPFGYVDSDAPRVLYWFKLVRLGGSRVDYIPHLMSARSGAGRQIQVADLDRDGRPDVVVSSRQGVFIFHNDLREGGSQRRPPRREGARRK